MAAALRSGYVGVKLDGDIEKSAVQDLAGGAYPTVVVLSAKGRDERPARRAERPHFWTSTLTGPRSPEGDSGDSLVK